MESWYISLGCLFASFLYLLITFNNKNSWALSRSRPSSLGAPPGRTGWPVIGESLEFIKTMRKGHPEKFVMDRMAKYSTHVFGTHILGEPVAVLCGAAGNKMLFSNENKLVTMWLPRSMDKILFGSFLKTGAEEASKMKKVSNFDFVKPHILQGYIEIMDDIAGRHFSEKWETEERVVVHPLVKHYTLWLACRLFLGIEDPHWIARISPHFSDLVAGLYSLPLNFPGTLMNKAIKASDRIRNEIVSIIGQRRIELGRGTASPMQDILTHMISTNSGNDDQIIACQTIALLVGGHDTATSVCTSIIKYLAELPEIYEAVRKEQMEIARSKVPGEFLNWEDIQKMKYSWNVGCEVMRLVPPVPGTFREAIVDFTYKGYSIPKGMKLYWSTHTTHKNPEFFPDPEKFDPSRFEGSGPASFTFMPFGGGPRMCPGKEYARMMILVFIHHLIKRFKWEKIIPHEQIVFHPIPVPANGLPIYLSPQKYQL